MALPPKRMITQDRLRSAVQELLLATDWSAITVQHVAERAGVSIGTFYNYYDCKDDALNDVRQCLSLMIKKDLNILLSTQADVAGRISLLLKYFINIVNAKPTWANYFYRAEGFSERIDGGVVALLEPLILEEAVRKQQPFYDAKMTASFIENGLFALLKHYHHNQETVPETDATHMSTLALSSIGVGGEVLAKAAKMLCPITPLAPLPQSIYELERTQAGYV